MLRFFILFCIVIVLSGCGTLYRIGQDNYQFARGQSLYNPYNPYYQAVRNDYNDIMPIGCFISIIIGCPLAMLDFPISFVTDTLMLPYDFTRGIYINYYNNKNVTYKSYGPFILKYSTIYKTGDFLDIYYLTPKNPLTSNKAMGPGRDNDKLSILPFQNKLLEKRLTPTPRLLVEDRFGAIFLIEVDLVGEVKISRVGDYKETVMLADDPNVRVFYRKMQQSGFGFQCTMLSCPEGFYEADSRSYTFDVVMNNELSIVSNQLTIKYPKLNCESEARQCTFQFYLLSLSPSKQQAVYLSNTGELWVLEKEGTFSFITDLNQEQQQSLNQLLGENKQKEDRLMDDYKKQESKYKKDSLALYRKYINWFTTNFTWKQSKTDNWQIINIKNVKN